MSETYVVDFRTPSDRMKRSLFASLSCYSLRAGGWVSSRGKERRETRAGQQAKRSEGSCSSCSASRETSEGKAKEA